MLYAVNNWCVIKCAMGQGTSLMMLCKWTSSLMRFKAIQSKRKKNNESFINFLRKMIVFLLISWHYALGLKCSLCAITSNQCFIIFTHLNFENIFIIISDHCYCESKSWKYVAYVVFLSQDICYIKIESEVSIWIVNLYWNRKKTWLS